MIRSRRAERGAHRLSEDRFPCWLKSLAVGVAAALVVAAVLSFEPSFPSRSGSGEPMPSGDLPGWRQVFADDFTSPAPTGSFLAVYGDRWEAYGDGLYDTSGRGRYSPEKTLSVGDGLLRMHLHEDDGQALSAAPVPMVDGRWGGLQYAKITIRFRADPVPGYKAAWLLWPDSDDWAEGEVNFPEGNLNGTFWAFTHCIGAPEILCFEHDTGVGFRDWHTASIEWLPDGVTFILDGETLGTSAVSPSVPMHLVLQTETSDGGPTRSTSGHVPADWPSSSGYVEVDWVTIYAPS